MLAPNRPRGVTWNGAGDWLIVSQARHAKRSRTVWITFYWRGTTSSVSVVSSPSFDGRTDPQPAQQIGLGITTRVRGRCAGNGWRDGQVRVNAVTVVVLAAAIAAAASSSLAVASATSSASSSWSIRRRLRSERWPNRSRLRASIW